MVDALDRVGRDAQAHVAAERVRDECDVAQVRQEAPLGLDVGVADLVADEGALGRQFAAPRHIDKSSSVPRQPLRPRGSKIRVLLTGSGRTYRGEGPIRQGFAGLKAASKCRFEQSLPLLNPSYKGHIPARREWAVSRPGSRPMA